MEDRSKNTAGQQTSPMAVNFNYIFTCITLRRTHKDQQSLVERTFRQRINDAAEIKMMGKQVVRRMRENKDLASDSFSLFPAYSDDCHSTLPRWGGNRSNSIALVHGLLKRVRSDK